MFVVLVLANQKADIMRAPVVEWDLGLRCHDDEVVAMALVCVACSKMRERLISILMLLFYPARAGCGSTLAQPSKLSTIGFARGGFFTCDPDSVHPGRSSLPGRWMAGSNGA